MATWSARLRSPCPIVLADAVRGVFDYAEEFQREIGLEIVAGAVRASFACRLGFALGLGSHVVSVKVANPGRYAAGQGEFAEGNGSA